VSTGIEARHARACTSRDGGRCSCAPTFQANVWDAKAGKRIRKTFATRSAAKRWRQDAIVALRTGDLSAERGPTLADAAERFLAAAQAGQIRNRSGDPYKPSALRGYRDTLRLRVLPKLGHLRLREIRTKDVQALVDDLVAAGSAAATIDSTLTPLRALYRRALVRGEVNHNPTSGILKPAVRPKQRRAVAPSEVDLRLAALDGEDRTLWATAFYAGLRRSELIGLRRADVDLAQGVLRIERGWDLVEGEVPPKSAQGRRKVPVPAALRDVLLEHLMDTTDRLALFRSQAFVCKAADRARVRWATANLDPLTLHEARHAYASLMIAAGVNAKALSTFMGHANIKVTFDLYGHLMPGSENEAAGMMDSYLARSASGSTVAQAVAQEPQPA
jgi:integrase